MYFENFKKGETIRALDFNFDDSSWIEGEIVEVIETPEDAEAEGFLYFYKAYKVKVSASRGRAVKNDHFKGAEMYVPMMVTFDDDNAEFERVTKR